MPLELHWQQIALRLVLATLASFCIGLNRDERARPAGLRTIMLVCLAATLAMLQVNLLLSLSGKGPGNFNSLDLMRLPLGILSGIGFIGAGAIIKRDNDAVGVTTAATLWYTTILGLLFGGGQIILGSVASILGLIILIAFKHIERFISHSHTGILTLTFGEGAPSEDEIREALQHAHLRITTWSTEYDSPTRLHFVRTNLKWKAPGHRSSHAPPHLHKLRQLPSLSTFRWEQ